MKTKKNPRVSSSVNIQVPQGWKALTPPILRYICALLSSEIFAIDEIKTYLLFKLSGMTRIAFAKAPPIAIANLFPELDWMDKSPDYPVRLPELHGCSAVDAELHGVTFEDYLCLENLYQGYVRFMSPAALNDMATILYPGLAHRLDDVDRYSIFLWMVGLKAHFSKMFPDLFKPVSGKNSDEEPDMRQIMISEIRALTGGDITKEKTVLQSDTWTALTELNEKSREYQEQKRKYKK